MHQAFPRAAVRAAAPVFASVAASLTTAVLLAGCSALGLGSDKVDYRAVPPPKPLEVPPDLTPLPPNERFAVPGVATASGTQAAAQSAQTQRAVAAVTSTVVAPSATNARIERAGSQRWLAVDVPPERAFAVAKDFWTSSGLKIEREDAAVGVIETEWAENRAKLPQDIIRRTIGKLLDGLYSTGEQDKFRTRIERTASGNSEIYISHRGMVEVYTTRQQDQTRWQPRPADTELEAEMLQKLLLRFAPATTTAAAPASSPTAAAAAAATGAAAAAKPGTASATTVPPPLQTVKLVTDGSASRLEISEPFDRAWRRVGLGLDRGGFTVEDRDRAGGLYFVRYLDPEFEAKQRQEQGLLSKIFGGDPKITAQQFRIQVAASGALTTVRVLDKDGRPEASATADKIIKQLNEQIR